MEKLCIPYPVIVEGKYDRLRLLCVMEGQILTTEGFGIFKQKEKLALFRALAKKSPLIVLTDPDGAGKLIRAHIGSAVPKDRLIPLYVPQIFGKERRKAEFSAEGFLGVEGQEQQLLYDLLAPFAGEIAPRDPITKTDLFEYGLTGKQNSSTKRDALSKCFALPAGMTPNALLAALNVIATREEFFGAAKTLDIP
jgi:ribonuclease M5